MCSLGFVSEGIDVQICIISKLSMITTAKYALKGLASVRTATQQRYLRKNKRIVNRSGAIVKDLKSEKEKRRKELLLVNVMVQGLGVMEKTVFVLGVSVLQTMVYIGSFGVESGNAFDVGSIGKYTRQFSAEVLMEERFLASLWMKSSEGIRRRHGV